MLDLIRRRTRSAGASGGDGDVQYAHGQAEVVRGYVIQSWRTIKKTEVTSPDRFLSAV